MNPMKHVMSLVRGHRKAGYIKSTVNKMIPADSIAGEPVLRRALLKGLVALVLVMFLSCIPVPETSAEPEGFERENVTLEGSYTDMQFLAGQSVRISANVADDVFAAGRDVTFDSATVKNAIVAGYDVELRSGKVSDMMHSGSQRQNCRTIEDDVVAAARSIRVSSGGTIGGDVRFAAETIDMEGRVGGNMRAAAARITITGKISGKADLLAERIVIASGAVIAGDLIYRSDEEPEIAEGAKIGGKVRRIEIDKSNLSVIGFSILGIGMFITLSWTIAMLLLVHHCPTGVSKPHGRCSRTTPVESLVESRARHYGFTAHHRFDRSLVCLHSRHPDWNCFAFRNCHCMVAGSGDSVQLFWTADQTREESLG